MAIAALVLGIVSIVACFIPGIGIVGPIVGIIGIILGALAKKKEPQNGKATAGLVCAIIGTALSLVFYIACVACVNAGLAAAGVSSGELQDIANQITSAQ